MRGESARHKRRVWSFALHARTCGEIACPVEHRKLTRGERCPGCLAQV